MDLLFIPQHQINPNVLTTKITNLTPPFNEGFCFINKLLYLCIIEDLINRTMEKYTYNGNIKTTQITTDENGVVVSKQEEIIVDWTDKDLYDEQ